MKKDNDRFRIVYAFFAATQLGFFVVLPIVGFSFLGKWMDNVFKTGSFFFSAGLFFGLLAAVRGTYKFLLPLISKQRKSQKRKEE
ncbi:MAG TPA: AtpZ/AtpI family protein [Candidatus Parcubacteria bacterium]|nr:AtpZ/AtpI family protein [Candidatus Parcubacteria bacterium]